MYMYIVHVQFRWNIVKWIASMEEISIGRHKKTCLQKRSMRILWIYSSQGRQVEVPE